MVDDGSTDATPSVCRRYAAADSRVRYLKKENRGSYQSRIHGAERARGTYVLFCDADDRYAHDGVFALLYDELKDESYDALQFGYIKSAGFLKRVYSPVTRPTDVSGDEFAQREYPVTLCLRWESSRLNILVWNKIYHRKLLTNLPSSESAERLFFSDDVLLNAQLLSTCRRFRFLPDVVYTYHVLSGGTSRFLINLLEGVDKVKSRQLAYTDTYAGEERELIRRRIFFDAAGMLFWHVQQALDFLDESEVLKLIDKTLTLPSFLLAKEFLEEHPEENWLAADLLRKSEAKAYLAAAQEARNRRKKSVKTVFRKIWTRIRSSNRKK